MYKIINFIIIFIIFQINAYSKDSSSYLMLKNSKVNVRYGPSFESPIKFFYKKKYLPVKIIDEKGNWKKIIDFKKNGGWIHRTQLKKSKSFIVEEDKILFDRPSIFSKPLVKIEKGKMLIFKKCKESWCNIALKDFNGWLQTDNIWGEIK